MPLSDSNRYRLPSFEEDKLDIYYNGVLICALKDFHIDVSKYTTERRITKKVNGKIVTEVEIDRDSVPAEVTITGKIDEILDMTVSMGE